MTTGDAREGIIEQLEEALRADDEDAKNVHIREAIQLLHLVDETRATDSESMDEKGKK